MSAHVVEAPELTGPGPYDEDALPGDVDLQEMTGGEERFLPTDAEPLRGEDALALPLEALLGKVGRGGEGPLHLGRLLFPRRRRLAYHVTPGQTYMAEQREVCITEDGG
jgi:hypothetical protein